MNATSADETPLCAKIASIPAMMPAATPSGAVCVVGSFTRAATDRVCASTATTSVNVPPTSMPRRSLRDIRREDVDVHRHLDVAVACEAIDQVAHLFAQRFARLAVARQIRGRVDAPDDALQRQALLERNHRAPQTAAGKRTERF